jgi:Uma2 family endonuclease
MTTAARLMTAEELWQMPSDDQRHELVKGELHTMAPAGFNHGVVINRLAFLLTRHVDTNALGLVTGAETGFLLSRNPDTVRAPNIGFVSKQRVQSAGRTEKFWNGPPDLAVEILSPSDTLEMSESKVDDYLSGGTPLVWVANPRRRTVTTYRAARNPQLLAENQNLEGEEVVPGFSVPVAEIFA